MSKVYRYFVDIMNFIHFLAKSSAVTGTSSTAYGNILGVGRWPRSPEYLLMSKREINEI